MELTEDERQHFDQINRFKNNKTLMSLQCFAEVGKMTPDNIHLVGRNAEDLRTYVIHAYQQNLIDAGYNKDKALNPLQYSARVIQNVFGLDHPFDQFQRVLKQINEEIAEREQAAKDEKREGLAILEEIKKQSISGRPAKG